MVRALILVLSWATLTLGLAASVMLSAEPTIRETREGGNSVIHIKATDGGEKVYRIDLSQRHSPASEQNDLLKKWESYRFGAFVCFNTNQFTGEEFCKTSDPEVYNPQHLDVAGWVAAFKDAGHEVRRADHPAHLGLPALGQCHHRFRRGLQRQHHGCLPGVRQGMPPPRACPGVLLLPLGRQDWNPHPNARAIILAQLYELATQFGEIPYFWIDMKNWAPADLSTQEIYDELKTLQPNCVVEFNQHVQDGTKISYFPTDVVDGELTPPPATGHNPFRKVGGKTYYLPFDYNLVSQSRPGGYDYDPLGPSCWFTYGEGKELHAQPPIPGRGPRQADSARMEAGGGQCASGDRTGPHRSDAARGRGTTSQPGQNPSW